MRAIQKSWLDTALHVLRDALHHSLPDRRYLDLLVVLILGLFGYWLGPKDLPVSDYSAKIDFSLNGHSLSVTYPFELGKQAGQPVTLSQSDGLYELTVEGEDSYKYELGQSISFRAQVLDANREPVQLALENISSTISGTGY